MQRLIAEMGQATSSVGAIALGMAAGVFGGPCQFFLVDGTHRELIVAGPAAMETIRLESQASAGEILVGGAVSVAEPEPFEQPPLATALELEGFIPVPLLAQLRLEGGEAEHRQLSAAFLKFDGVDAVHAEGGVEALHEQLASLARLVGETSEELSLSWLVSDIDTDGGKLLLVAGAPTSTGEDEERMLRGLRRILDGYGGTLTLRAGVNRGSAFCGDVGARSRRSYTVMGDSVNLAARLAARAEPGGILVTGDVLERARTRYASRPQPFLVKGKERSITAYHLGAATGELKKKLSAELPLVGRDAELAALAEAVTAARLREQRLVELVGEPGIGKSRLVEELKRQALGFSQLIASGDPYERANPYFALRALLRPLAGIMPELDERAAGAQLVPWVQAVLPAPGAVAALLAIPFGADVPMTPETEQIDPSFRRERLHDTVEQFLSRVLMMPTLLVVEDAHWADDASFELLRHLVRQPAQRPWLVCVTRRPQDRTLAGDVGGHALLTLERLDAEAAQSLALSAAGAHALSTEALDAVGERSGGNPLFVRELVEATRAAGRVNALPETVDAVITSRIDTLSAEDRFVLRNASVLGARFELDVLAEVLADDLEDLGEHARWERLSEYIAWEGVGRLRFVHDLFRAVAYEGMSFGRRRELHARVALALEQRQGDPALLSLHFLEAGLYEKAWANATVAADQARAGFANVVAAELYDRALSAAEHIELPAREVARVAEALGDVADLFADFERASVAYGRARTLVGDLARLLLKEGRVREHRGLYVDALRWFARGIAAADDDEETRIELETAQGGVLFRQARYEESIESCKRAIEHAEAAGETAALAHACFVLDATLTHLGRFDPTWNERARALYEQLGDQNGLGSTLNNLGIHAYYAGRWGEALDFYRRSRDAKERSGDVEGAAMALNNEAEILSDQGRYEPAKTLFEEALRVARAADHPMMEAFVTANLGRLAARTSRFDEAHALFDDAAEELDAIGSAGLVLETDARRAECLVLEGRHREALELAEQALVRTTELGRLATLGPSLERALGYALHQGRRPDESQPRFEESLRLARKAQAGYEVAMTLRALAETTTGNSSREAEELFDQLGVVSTPSVPLP